MGPTAWQSNIVPSVSRGTNSARDALLHMSVKHSMNRDETRRAIAGRLDAFMRELEQSFRIDAEELIRIVAERLEAQRSTLAATGRGTSQEQASAEPAKHPAR